MTNTSPEPTVDEVFSMRLQSVREQRGLSQADLATLVTRQGTRMDQTMITRLERGLRAVKLREAIALARVLEVSLGELAPDTHEPTPPDAESIRLAQSVVDAWRKQSEQDRQTLAGVSMMLNMVREGRTPRQLVETLQFLGETSADLEDREV